MKWPWVSRFVMDVALAQADAMATAWHKEREEVKRLTDVIIHMKEARGMELRPGHDDEVWPGPYVLDEPLTSTATRHPDTSTEEEARTAAEVEAMIDRDLRNAFPDED